MIKLITILSMMSFFAHAQSEQLQSKKIRKIVCQEMLEVIEGEGIQKTYRFDFGDDLEVLPKFERKCLSSKESYQVSHTIYNENAKKVVEIAIDIVNFQYESKMKLTGSIVFKRTAFDPNSGEVKLGEWKVKSNNIKMNLKEGIIPDLAKVIAYSSNVHNGDAGVSQYDPQTFDLDYEIKALNEEVELNNEDSGSCKMGPYSQGYESSFKSLSKDGGDAFELYQLLKKAGYVIGLIGNDSEIWEESCAYHNVFIYFIDGTRVAIGYDFTT